MNSFAVLILTNRRPDRVVTIRTLRRSGYTGKIYIVVDDEDDTIDEYRKLHENVIVFDKEAIGRKFDLGDNWGNKQIITYARNASFEIAEEIGLDYFIQLDDDYTAFRYTDDTDGNYAGVRKIKSLDRIFELMIEFCERTQCNTLAMAQGGDFIGGESSSVFTKKLARKSMNSFMCSTKRRFMFIGGMNEDVCTYTSLGSRGELFFTVCHVRLEQIASQSNSGGVTELYLKLGTYVKSFYAVMMCPSFVKVSTMGLAQRIHHKINWKNGVPLIVSEDLRKPRSA